MKKSALALLIIGGILAFAGMILAIVSMRYVWFTVAGFILVFVAIGMNKKKKKDKDEKEYVEVLSAKEEKKEDIFEVAPEPQVQEEKIEDTSETNCPTCGASVGKTDKFCPSCGKKLIQEEKKAVKKYCIYCGHEISLSARFCPSCGEEVAGNTDEDNKL